MQLVPYPDTVSDPANNANRPAQAGDAAATARLFDVAYTQHWDNIVAEAQRQLEGSRNEAEDVAQTAFVDCLWRVRTRRALPHPDELRIMLVQFTLRRAVDGLRSRRTYDSFLLHLNQPRNDRWSPGPEETVERRMVVASFIQAMRSLAPRERSLLVLFQEGMNTTEIAESLNIQAPVADQRLHSARRHLFIVLAEQAKVKFADREIPVWAMRDETSTRTQVVDPQVVEQTSLRGRVLQVEDDELVAVAGPDDDEMGLVAHIPLHALSQEDRMRVRPGSLFVWLLEQWPDPAGGLIGRSLIRLRPETAFTDEQRARIENRARTLSSQLASFERMTDG
jgi:RNA polymerase sigma factor (sigma-70 family)